MSLREHKDCAEREYSLQQTKSRAEQKNKLQPNGFEQISINDNSTKHTLRADFRG